MKRHDPRYVDEDDSRAKLGAYWGDLPMGAWTDEDEDAFREAVIDQLKFDLVSDGSATHEEIVKDISIFWLLIPPHVRWSQTKAYLVSKNNFR